MLIRAFFAALWCAYFALPAAAQSYPTGPVRIVVAYAPGATADSIARLLANRLGAMWNQTVIVENRAGGGTQIAAETVAKTAPDGLNLLFTGMETFTIKPFLSDKPSYDTVKDFVAIRGMGSSNQMLAVPVSSPHKTVADIVGASKAKSAVLQYGTVGLGGSSHVNMVLFESFAGIKMTPVHYRGGAPMLNDIVGAHLSLAFAAIQMFDPQVRAGKLRAIAVGSKSRLAEFPDVPTIEEAGYKGFEAVSWFGLFAPAGTPPDIVRKINNDISAIFADPEVRAKFLAPNFLNSMDGDPAAFNAYLKVEAEKWSKLIRETGMKEP